MRIHQPAHNLYVLVEGLPPTVIDSQVIEPLEQLASAGVVFDLLITTGLKPAWKERKRNAKRLTEIRTQLSRSRVHFYAVPLPSHTIGRAYLRLLLLCHILALRAGGAGVIVHCRGHSAAAAARSLKPSLLGFRYVFDIRGDVLAEAGLRAQCSEREWHHSSQYRKLKRLEESSIEGAWKIVCVSEYYQRWLTQEYAGANSKITVIPCVASEKLFRFDEKERRRVRDVLGLEDKLVLTYAGGLEAPWHVPETLFRLVSDWMTRESRLHLLLLTHDRQLASRLMRQEGLDETRVTLLAATHREVPSCLAAADVGLLVRRPNRVNKVASPTKFAEYAMSGLVILASSDIGDIDDHVGRYHLGVLLEDLDDGEHCWGRLRQALTMIGDEAERERRAAAAAGLYSAEKALRTRLQLYSPRLARDR